MMLYKLLQYSLENDRSIKHSVFSLQKTPGMESQLLELGVPVYKYNLKSVLGFFSLFHLIIKIRVINPSLLQTWMYHADLVGVLVKVVNFRTPLLWNIRHSNFSPSTKILTRFIAKSCAYLSYIFPSKILVNSRKGEEFHCSIGYCSKKFHYIPNGFDMNRFESQKSTLKKELQIPDSIKCIGIVGRYHPQKDHLCFLNAASEFISKKKTVRFVLCGEGIHHDNEALINVINRLDLTDHVELLGERSDIPNILNGLDIFTMCSAFGEGFPNVLGEAMACGIPPVVTDVGDSVEILNSLGKTVEIGNWRSLSNAWEAIFAMSPLELKKNKKLLRDHINSLYSLSTVCGQYSTLYKSFFDPSA